MADDRGKEVCCGGEVTEKKAERRKATATATTTTGVAGLLLTVSCREGESDRSRRRDVRSSQLKGRQGKKVQQGLSHSENVRQVGPVAMGFDGSDPLLSWCLNSTCG